MRYIVLVIFLPFILAGCLNKSVDDKQNTIDVRNVNEEVSNGEIPIINNFKPRAVKQVEYNLTEIAKHNNVNDCWLLIDDKIYDVTEYISSGKHPGGEAILEGCGKIDGTELFSTRPMGSGTEHSDEAYGYLDTFYIANFKK